MLHSYNIYIDFLYILFFFDDVPLVRICRTNPMQSLDRTFQLTRADKDLLSKQEYDVQVG